MPCFSDFGSRLLRRAAVLAAALGCLTSAAWAAGVPKLDERAALQLSQSVIGTQPTEHTLLDRRSQPVRLSSYRGKPLLVSFIYTGCFEICPTQTRALHEAVKGLDKLIGEDQYNVISIGFNQPFDSPQAMRAFAAQHRIDYRNWEFLSPHRDRIEPLMREFGFSYVATPAGFDHLVGVTVVDAEGRIYSQVYGDRMTAEQIGEPLRQLMKLAPLATGSSLGDLIERVRVLCTVYDPDTGRYRYDWGLFGEISGGLLFFITVGWYLTGDWRRRRAALKGQSPALTTAVER